MGKFVGRTEELKWLEDEFKLVVEHRKPRISVILGDPGQGKTRLVQEFYQKLASDPEWDPEFQLALTQYQVLLPARLCCYGTILVLLLLLAGFAAGRYSTPLKEIGGMQQMGQPQMAPACKFSNVFGTCCSGNVF